MAEILGLGLSHYPPLSSPDAQMSAILRLALRDPGIPADIKVPESWPQAMRAEWGDDEGAKGAADRKSVV